MSNLTATLTPAIPSPDWLQDNRASAPAKLAPGTSTVERFLLAGTIFLLPLEEQLPGLGGFSILWFAFAGVGIYCLLFRLEGLIRVVPHPLFLSAYLLLIVGALMEPFHPHASYIELLRIAQMVMGAVFIATLCRDRRALRAALYGCILASLWLSVVLILTSYGTLAGSTAEGFEEASQARAEAFEDRGLKGNLNMLSFLAGEGAVVALALALKASSLRRWVFGCTALFCAVASFLPLSRSGIIMVFISSTGLLFTVRAKRTKNLMMATALGISLFYLVPQAVWERFSPTAETYASGKVEARTKVYYASLQTLPLYYAFGVGSGHFYENWGYDHGFGKVGSHNCFIQVTMYWGIAGFLALFLVLWQAYRCLPHPAGNEVESLALLGTALSMFLLAMFIHDLYTKEFALALGILAGSQLWIWPSGRVPKPARS